MQFCTKLKKKFVKISEIRDKLFCFISLETYKVLKTLQEEKNLSTFEPLQL